MNKLESENLFSKYSIQNPLQVTLMANQFTHNIFAHNIEIRYLAVKRLKDIFHPIFFSSVNRKYLFLDNYVYWNLLWKDFKMSLKYIKISFYLNIVLKNVLCDVGLNLELFLIKKLWKNAKNQRNRDRLWRTFSLSQV